MNVFKKFYTDLMERLHFDVKLKDRGVTFDVELKEPKEKEDDWAESILKKKAMFVSARGMYNPIGGILCCALYTTQPTPGCCFIPKIDNMANKFLFLNGKLLPDNIAKRVTLSQYILGDDFCEVIRSNRTSAEWDSIELGDGYTLTYVYFRPAAINNCLKESNQSILELMKIVTRDIFTGDKDTLFVTVTENDEFENSAPAKKDTLEWVNSLNIDSFWEKVGVIGSEDDTSLVDDLTDYLYSNILKIIEADIFDMTQSHEAHDIPWTNNELAQTKWLAKIKKSVKDKDVWNQVVNQFVINWPQ